MKNVLLLCLSPIRSSAQVNKYSVDIDGEAVYFEGSMTNEAPAKSVIKKLSRLGERLDRIVMICSGTVERAAPFSLDDGAEYTHTQLFCHFTDSYAERTDSRYVDEPIEYVRIPIADFTNDYQVSEAVASAASEITGEGDRVNLYIDFNGGQRYVAFMILAIANLMKNRGVGIADIMTMNFENRVDGVIPIQDMSPLFESFDLVSGINEYINYGRIRGLKNYFSAAGEEICNILSELETFSNNLQLCRTGYIMENKGALLQRLSDYLKKSEKETYTDTYTRLFAFVIKDIIDGMRGLLSGTLPEIIRWCVKKEFIQQALTFCSEEMPHYFVESGIFAPTKEEAEEYRQFIRCVRQASSVEKELREYKKTQDSSPSKMNYNWMIKYLPFSGERDPYADVLTDGVYSDDLLMFVCPDIYVDLPPLKKDLNNFLLFDMKAVPNRSQLIRSIDIQVTKALWHCCVSGERVTTTVKKRHKLREILTVYYLLKQQRNMTNHADTAADNSEWDYGTICSVLSQFSHILLAEQKEE